MAAHTDAQDEPAPGEPLERRGLLGHGGGLAQGELQYACTQRRASRRRSGDGQRGEALVDRMGPEQVVDGPQGIGSGRLRSHTELAHVLRRPSGNTGGTTALIS